MGSWAWRRHSCWPVRPLTCWHPRRGTWHSPWSEECVHPLKSGGFQLGGEGGMMEVIGEELLWINPLVLLHSRNNEVVDKAASDAWRVAGSCKRWLLPGLSRLCNTVFVRLLLGLLEGSRGPSLFSLVLLGCLCLGLGRPFIPPITAVMVHQELPHSRVVHWEQC